MHSTLVSCPSCRVEFRYSASSGAPTARCPKCGTSFDVPDNGPAPAGQAIETAVDGRERSGQATQDLGSPPPSAQRSHDSLDFLRPPEQPDELGRLGPYRVLKVLGQGGMGLVLQAEDPKLRRQIALKIMLPRHAADMTARQRFLREAQAQAALEHDHIIAVFQVDEDQGVPFLAMPLLKGQTLADYLKHTARLPLAEVLRIGREIAEGLQSAHESGLIHRDIKPGNVWLEGSRRRVKILDFGLARAHAVPEDQHLTQTGAVLGTPAYMSPEQGRGEALDGRSDLFSLGCVLYQMTTGELPFQGTSTLAILTALAVTDPVPPRDRNPGVPVALSDLIIRLLAKRADDRPATAQAVAEQLLALERIDMPTATSTLAPAATNRHPAAPTTAAARPVAAKTQAAPRRRRLLPALALGVAVALGGGLVLPQVILRIKGPGGKETKIEAPEGSNVKVEPDGSVRIVLPERLGPAIKQRPGARSAFDDLDPAQIPARERFAGQPPELVAVFGDSRLRHWNSVASVLFTPDGKEIISASSDGTVRLWDFATGEQKRILHSHEGNFISLSVSKDGKALAALSNTTLVVWDLASWKEKTIATSGSFVAFFNDSKRLAYGGQAVYIMDYTTGKRLNSIKLPAHPAQGAWLAISQDDQRLAACVDGTVRLIDVASGQVARTLKHPSGGVSVLFSPDGRDLLSAGDDGRIRFWDLESGAEKRILELTAGRAISIAFDPDGKYLAAAQRSSIKLFDTTRYQCEKEMAGVASADIKVAFSPDGRWLVGGSQSGAIQVWDVNSGAERLPSASRVGTLTALAVSSSGLVIATGREDRSIRLWDAKNREEGRILGDNDTDVSALAFSPSGTTLAAGLGEGKLQFRIATWESGGEPSSVIGRTTNRPRSMKWSPDGKLVAAVDYNRDLTVWDSAGSKPIESRKPLFSPPKIGPSAALAFSRDAKTIAVAGARDVPSGNLLVSLRDATTGKELRTLNAQEVDRDSSLAFSPDGKSLYAGSRPGSDDGKVTVWDVETGLERPGWKTRGHRIALRPDGQVLYTAGHQGIIEEWQLIEGAPGSLRREIRIGPPAGYIEDLLMSPDGRHLIIRNYNGTAYVLRVAGPPQSAPAQ